MLPVEHTWCWHNEGLHTGVVHGWVLHREALKALREFIENLICCIYVLNIFYIYALTTHYVMCVYGNADV